MALELFVVNFTTVTVLILVGVAAVCLLSVRRRKTLPPGPSGYPLIGNITQVDLTNTINEFPRLREQYGDVFCIKLFHRPNIVVHGREAITDLLVKHADSLSERPENLFINVFSKGLGVISSSGALWKEHRTFALKTLKNFGFGKRSVENQIRDEIELFLTDISNTDGKPFDIQSILSISISNIICSISLGTHFDHSDKRLLQLLEMMNENLSIPRGIMNLFPWLRHVPGDPFRSRFMMESMQKVLDLLDEIVEEHRKTFDVDNIRDYIDAYLAEKKRQVDVKGSTFTDLQLIQTLRDFFVAALDTTTNTLRWAALYLIRNPDIQTKMRQEMERVLGSGRFPSMDDKPNLPYCEAVILETQRIGSIVPNSLPHGVKYDIEWKGYTIPKGAIVMPNLLSVAMDAETFPEPKRFDPKRFLDENEKCTGQNRIMPFSIGCHPAANVLMTRMRNTVLLKTVILELMQSICAMDEKMISRRVCIGETLAKMELFLFLTSLIQRFELLPENVDYPDTTGVEGVTYAPKPFKMKVVPVK